MTNYLRALGPNLLRSWKRYVLYWVPQVVVPVFGLLVLPEPDLGLLLLLVVGPMATVLPLTVLLNSRRDIRRLQQALARYQFVLQHHRYAEHLTDEYHFIKTYDAAYEIAGSDVTFQVRLTGVNLHPSKKAATEFRTFTGVNLEGFRTQIRVIDKSRKQNSNWNRYNYPILSSCMLLACVQSLTATRSMLP